MMLVASRFVVGVLSQRLTRWLAVAEVDIRRANERDAPAVWPLVERFAASFEPMRVHFDAAFSAVVGDPSMLALVAVGETGTVGYLLANRHQTLLANAPVVWVGEIMVAEPARRRGVGRALMQAAESWAVESGAAYVALATRRAGAFYAALGFEESAAFFRKLV